MSRVTVYVPCDTGAVSLGADRVAERLARECRDHPVDIVRNGSRGAFWLEPLLEVEAGGQRIAYGPVRPDDIPRLLEEGMLSASTRSAGASQGNNSQYTLASRTRREMSCENCDPKSRMAMALDISAILPIGVCEGAFAERGKT